MLFPACSCDSGSDERAFKSLVYSGVFLVMADEKLFFATPLFDFGYGFAPAEIGDGFIRSCESS